MEPCAQQAILDCTFGTSWNGIFASMFEPLFNCVKDKGKTCKAPIWQHFVETVVAFEEEFKKHREKFNEYFLKIQAWGRTLKIDTEETSFARNTT